MTTRDSYQLLDDIQRGCLEMGYGSDEKPWRDETIRVISYKYELFEIIEDE